MKMFQLGETALLHLIGGLCCISLYQEESGTATISTSCFTYAGMERLDGNGKLNRSKFADRDIKPRSKANISIIDEVVGDESN
jgi:hypothetical protein